MDWSRIKLDLENVDAKTVIIFLIKWLLIGVILLYTISILSLLLLVFILN